MMEELQQLAAHIVEGALQSGATAADCVIHEGNEFSTTIRCGEVEHLKEAGAKSLGLRVFLGHRTASAYTSDFSHQGVERLVASALAAARVTSEDPCAGLPEPEVVGQCSEDLNLFSEDVTHLEAHAMMDLARQAERAAFAFDPRIQNSEGSSFDATYGRKILATSQGFLGEYRRSSCSLSVVPIAVAGPQAGAQGMQRDYWYSIAHGLAGLEPAEAIGRKAAERAVRRLGARKVATCRVPVVFDQRTARSILGSLFEALSGESIYRRASFLAGKLGEKVASEAVTLVDDGTLRGGFGSSPFDGEGVRTGRTVVIERGVLKSYLLNCYTARKLGLKTTGNAGRGVAGNPGVRPTNFFLEPGTESPEAIIRSVKNGFYATEFMGFGFNAVTGDLSYGAAGLWIENGELAYPVEEVTIAGNLLEVLQAITQVGNDLEFRGPVTAPTFQVAELTVAGQ
ncbi:MAG: TldD/PmbA family protein [Acidobacteria bacterium]|nr:TldD/PmbA family protein [Acidobacteriota bacterium]